MKGTRSELAEDVQTRRRLFTKKAGSAASSSAGISGKLDNSTQMIYSDDVYARHDRILFFSVHVNSGYGILRSSKVLIGLDVASNVASQNTVKKKVAPCECFGCFQNGIAGKKKIPTSSRRRSGSDNRCVFHAAVCANVNAAYRARFHKSTFSGDVDSLPAPPRATCGSNTRDDSASPL